MATITSHMIIPIISAHAALGTIAWGLILPLGAILFTLKRYPSTSPLHPSFHIFLPHTLLQTLGVAMALANFGLGISIGLQYKKLYNNPHTIVGTVVVALMVFQPVWGGIHHWLFVKQKRERRRSAVEEDDGFKSELGVGSGSGSEEKDIESASASASARHMSDVPSSSAATTTPRKRDRSEMFSKSGQTEKWAWFGMAHRWIGRATIMLAMINGGLGFWLSKLYRPIWSFGGEVVYIVLVSIMFVVWQGFVFGGWWSRRRESKMTR